ncbi:TonB-dependent receptor [Henriciella litoralis]|uniref:TonB-dependent receptor n=1 Tax=Henriciella litoralis TaxID=568102 RepID=UPI00146EAC48|nr:TonB-dependent receptor [Henriciella litoralis]
MAQTAVQADNEKAGDAVRSLETVTVTARRTEERLLDVPVAASALDAEALERYGTNDLSSIAGQVVGVELSRSASSTSGGSFTIRGVGNLANDLGNEQPVAVNIDNVIFTRGRVVNVAQFDMERFEVLKGPQALFFGKNSPAGVVSVLSRSPTLNGEIEGYVKGEYQFYTNTPSIEGAVSLPVSDKFAIRLAGRFSDMQDGYYKNVAKPRPDPFPAEAGMTIRGASYKWGPGTETEAARLTALWQPMSNLTATFKTLVSSETTNNGVSGAELIGCGGTLPTTYGLPDPTGDCKGDRVTSNGLPPIEVTRNLYNAPDDGKSINETNIWLSSLTVDWDVGPFTFTSVTGYYEFDNYAFDNFDYTTWGQATNTQDVEGSQLTQEFRVVSAFDGPVNFTGGVFLQDDEREYASGTKIAALGPYTGGGEFDGIYDSLVTTAANEGETVSAFGQLRWQVTDAVEVAGGARWTHEEKKTDIGNIFRRPELAIFAPAGFRYTPEFSDDNISPEVTISWKPQDNLTIYGAYKTGYLSGGSSNPATVSNYTSLPDPERPFRYKSQTVEGGEIGIKGSFLNGRLVGDATAYHYDIENLQVQVFDAPTTSFFTQNAGGARNKGIEGQVQYMANDDLTLRLGAQYADLKFTDYDGAQCYAGQTVLPIPAAGQGKMSGACYANAAGGKQRYMTGLRYGSAPFQVITGLTYDRPVSDSWNMTATVDGYFYNATPKWLIPYSPEGGPRQVLNASVRFSQIDGPWTLSLIGTNVTDESWFPPARTDKPLGAAGDIVTYNTMPPALFTLQATYQF